MSDMKEAIEMGVRNALCWAVPIIQQEAVITLEAMRRPSVLYRPAISLDGNQWCALYGANLHDGVVGFGDSPALAMEAFDRAWSERNGGGASDWLTP